MRIFHFLTLIPEMLVASSKGGVPVKPETLKVAKPEAAKPAAQPKKPEAAAKPIVSEADKKNFEETMRRMQAQREREELKQKLAQLGSQDSRQPAAVPGAPVGMPDGKGAEAGTDEQTWIKTFLRDNWSLSEYQIGGRLDLVANVQFQYGSGGNLINYRITRSSDAVNFDESVKRAILKEKQLPFRPGRPLDTEVEFNLKELLNRR